MQKFQRLRSSRLLIRSRFAKRSKNEPALISTFPRFYSARKFARSFCRRSFSINRFFYPDHSATSQMLSDIAFGLAGKGLAGHRHHKSAFLPRVGRQLTSVPRSHPQCRNPANLDVPVRARSPRRRAIDYGDILPIDRDSGTAHRAARRHSRCQDRSADAVHP